MRSAASSRIRGWYRPNRSSIWRRSDASALSTSPASANATSRLTAVVNLTPSTLQQRMALPSSVSAHRTTALCENNRLRLAGMEVEVAHQLVHLDAVSDRITADFTRFEQCRDGDRVVCLLRQSFCRCDLTDTAIRFQDNASKQVGLREQDRSGRIQHEFRHVYIILHSYSYEGASTPAALTPHLVGGSNHLLRVDYSCDE